MADTTYYVNTDSTAGGDGTTNATAGVNRAYATLNEAENARDADITGSGGHVIFMCSAPSGVADTVAVAVAGWTTDTTHRVKIIGADDFGGKWDTSKYRLSVANTTALSLGEEFVEVHNLQVEITASDGNGEAALSISGIVAGGSEFVVEGCIFRNHTSDTFWASAVSVNDTDIVTVYIYNCVIVNRVVVDSSNNHGLFIGINASGNAYIYNNTIYGNGASSEYGIRQSTGVVVCINNIVQNFGGNDFQGTFDAAGQTNISSDATDTGDVTDINNTTLTFIGIADTDFHLAVTDVAAIDAGTVDPGSGLFSDDLDDVARGAAWDIGALEYVAAGGLSIPVAMAHYRRRRM